MSTIRIPFFAEIKDTACKLSCQAYIVGGSVRDIIMGGNVTDVDIVPFGCDYQVFAKSLSKKCAAYAVPFKDNMRITKGGFSWDISKPRGKDIHEDLGLRDFTINNLALTLDEKIIGDDTDIRKKVIRAVFDGTFDDDPLRVLRGYRFASLFGFTIEKRTLDLMEQKKELILNVASERIRQEISKIFYGNYLKDALHLMEQSGILNIIFHSNDIDYESILRLKDNKDKLGDKFFIIAATLLAGAKSEKYLSLSVKETKLSRNILNSYGRLIGLDFSNIRDVKVFLWRNKEYINELIAFARGKSLSFEKKADKALEILSSLDTAKANDVNGGVLQELGFKPSPLFKEIIGEVEELLVLDELLKKNIKPYIIEKYGGRL